MNGLLVLLFCKEVLCAVATEGPISSSSGNIFALQAPQSTTNVSASISGVMSTQSPTTVSSSHADGAPAITTTKAMSHVMFYRKECLPLLMMTGGLIISCFILLFLTLFFACKVYQLNRRCKMASGTIDQISNSEYLLGVAKKNKSQSETEAMLMDDFSQTQEGVGNGPTLEEGENENEDGQMGEENKKEVGDTVKSEEDSPGENGAKMPVTAEAHSSSSKPQEDAIAPHEAAVACPSEGTG
ncbi:uncharacterized protein LOC113143172 [Mastacembelus armatus]|uniref:uncharacterized protein LOC113143172 n=1 Tax=Mastacembelus armatus TaxID=205130 RepID=UPI000E456423|nr:uncharacterized protein LOC113143172 [Mastacembelus armatus]